jgi:hypothetical protein
MDEEKLNQLFRTILENKLSTGPGTDSHYSSSDFQTTNDSSLGDETHYTHDDAFKELGSILANMNSMELDINSLLQKAKSGMFNK